MEFILSHCLGYFSQHGSLFGAFFLAGLTGGITHCLSMCSGVAIAETVTCASACSANCKRVYLPGGSYHLGRMISYGGLGFMAAFLSKQIAAMPFWPFISTAMLLIAGCMFVVSSIPNCRHRLVQFLPKIHVMRGILLGFMPCGLLYAALMMAATLANPLQGMVAMWLFTLGTMPVLLAASTGAAFIMRKWQNAMQIAGRVMMVFNGLSLWVIAVKNVI